MFKRFSQFKYKQVNKKLRFMFIIVEKVKNIIDTKDKINLVD